MGSFKHPRVYDAVTIENIRDTFHEIIDEIDAGLAFNVSEQRLKAHIIERLLRLADDGTPQNEWKSQVLSSLPPR